VNTQLVHTHPARLHRLRQAGRGLLDLIFPPRCVGCARLGAWLCPACQDSLERFEPPICPRCGAPLRGPHPGAACLEPRSPLDHLRSVAAYAGPLQPAIQQFKYHDLRDLAGPLGQLMAEAWAAVGMPSDLIVPVPLHPTRLRTRGYNQSALLARELGQRVGLPVRADAMQRIRNTRPQTRLSAAERQANVHRAFVAIRSSVAGCRVVLIDDVQTSGATLRACARALRQAGATSICGFTLARAGGAA
jgi:ComF family protein